MNRLMAAAQEQVHVWGASLEVETAGDEADQQPEQAAFVVERRPDRVGQTEQKAASEADECRPRQIDQADQQGQQAAVEQQATHTVARSLVGVLNRSHQYRSGSEKRPVGVQSRTHQH